MKIEQWLETSGAERKQLRREGIRNQLRQIAPFASLFLLCVVWGACIWIFSPRFTGEKEPWDSLTFYYRGCLLLGGLVAGLLLPRRFWLWAVGIWLGQIVGFLWHMHLTRRVGPLAPLGFIVFLPLYSLWSLFGAFVGAGIRKLVGS